ncbi:DUF4326 domain-containing protein [Methylobacillus flagellatus]|uniref:DUF4326 domain-containing protein n=1 Tax=Methylobacillus flagellatus TaxID=405 RepID=UPI002853D88B|nr:DUF4326 domain-containing protein [Methylobacillus flagellatus]MDR5172975.1 DUF4326 domain-containing protein [Methylobacillus flagellatus]
MAAIWWRWVVGEARRVRLSRAKGWRMPENTVKVDRSTPWGNPFNWRDLPRYSADAEDDVGDRYSDAMLRHWSVCDFEAAVKYDIGRPSSYPSNAEIRRSLGGKNLACWCPLDQRCHADVLLEIANAKEPPHDHG